MSLFNHRRTPSGPTLYRLHEPCVLNGSEIGKQFLPEVPFRAQNTDSQKAHDFQPSGVCLCSGVLTYSFRLATQGFEAVWRVSLNRSQPIRNSASKPRCHNIQRAGSHLLIRQIDTSTISQRISLQKRTYLPSCATTLYRSTLGERTLFESS